MPDGTLLQAVAAVGFLAALAGAMVYIHRFVPRAYPREETRLDERTYRVVRAGIAVGVVLGAVGAVLSVVDAVGTVQVLGRDRRGLLGGLAILIPLWLARSMVYAGVGVLLGSALLAGAVEAREVVE